MRFLKQWFEKIPSFATSGRFSLTFLNISQSLGVVNDNIFKFSMAFFLIHLLGANSASSILSATGAIYVIPFLLFSSSAGILADRLSKQKLLALMKIAEVLLMILAMLAFATKTVTGCYILLFFLSTHSALFSPSKYGIIAELVAKESVSKANGIITSFTYLSIIVGTFLASFLTEMTDRNFVLIAGACLVFAVIGLVVTLLIRPTKPQGEGKTMNPFFIRDILQTLKMAKGTRHLLPSILGSSYFLMIGAFTQLNIIPFAIQSLHLDEVAGGYLFLATACGIAIGSFIAGRASKRRIELGLSCVAGLAIAFFFFCLSLFSSSLFFVILFLVGIGIFGGCFIVPFDTFNQLSSKDEKRGQTIAAANFLGFFGVFLASVLLYILNTLCDFTPATSFAIIGAITALITCVFIFVLSDLFFSYFSFKIYARLTRFSPPSQQQIHALKTPFLILENASSSHALNIAASFPSVHFLIPKGSKLWRSYYHLFQSIEKIEDTSHETLLESALASKKEGITTCLLLDKPLDRTKVPPQENALFSLFKKNPFSVYLAKIEKTSSGSKISFELL
ncbi:MAG: hypothetical protein RLZZ453_832 [Chlamydiota bacterium]|jgi:acyl-[acyl-carrier-protein]-phospholipid O-acyltransferase/long-chain-fatty-acid--[acyl-carrier-protein] ligase